MNKYFVSENQQVVVGDWCLNAWSRGGRCVNGRNRIAGGWERGTKAGTKQMQELKGADVLLQGLLLARAE